MDGVIAPLTANFKNNIKAYKYFNFSKNFYCKIRGHLTINPQIFVDPKSMNEIKTVYLQKLSNVFTLRLYSEDVNCPINLEAEIRYKKDRTSFKTLMFTIFVLIIGGFIIKGGYQIILKISEDTSIAKNFSIVTLMGISSIDFGLMMNFLIMGI